ncbi:MAG: glutamate--tRNA ligase [Anaerolineae bacterium]
MTVNAVRVRYAPSPTGYFHVGGARSALYNWLFARRHGGQFILRMEDTDRTRYEPNAIPDLLESLRWLGLCWDEGPEVGGEFGPYYQSDRLPLYHEAAERLLADGRAYRCYCSPERLAAMRERQRATGEPPGYDRRCRSLTRQQIADYEAQGVQAVVRLAVPLEGETVFEDVIRGQIAVSNSQLDDIILLKSDGFPTYSLASVVDDHLMQISHILRGDEWLATAPKLKLLFDALGWEMPTQAHLPVILDPSGHGKLSKRKKKTDDGREMLTYVYEFRQAGYLPEALVNYLALVGWSHDGQTEFFSRDELIRYFDLDRVNKSPGAFSYEKLDFVNATYLRGLGPNDLAGRLLQVLRGAGRPVDLDLALRLVPLVRERLTTLQDILPMTDFVFASDIQYDASLLIQKKMDKEGTLAALAASERVLASLPGFDEITMEPALRELAESMDLKVGLLFGVIRVAATGRTVTPPLFGTLDVLGRELVLQRLRRAQELLAAT